MNTLQKEDFIQAVLIADAYDKTLQPFVKEGSTVRIKSKRNNNIIYVFSWLHADDAMCQSMKQFMKF